jgi:2-oxoisovalerate dehydrogenase E1 component
MVTPTHEPTYHSDTRPDFAPFEESAGTIAGFTYGGSVATEVESGRLGAAEALDLLDDLLAIRELEEMIVRLRSGGYDALPGYDYRGPTHVSIGQEGTAVGAAAALRSDDAITSSHRGHGDAVAKGFAAIRLMEADQLRARLTGEVPASGDREALLAAALEEHLYRIIAELFGKEEGYCRGRGGGVPLRAQRPGGVLHGRRRGLRQRRGPGVAQLGDAAPVDQPPGGRPPARAADHLPDPEQPLRHDPPHR